MSHIYGLENSRQMALRSMANGKMKVRFINGEEFPPLLSDAPVQMYYPADFPEEEKVSFYHFTTLLSPTDEIMNVI